MITLKDVAKLAGVDISTASRTLRNAPVSLKLREETRAKIFEAARKLGYQRNIYAAAMRTGVVAGVAVIHPAAPEIAQSLSSLRVIGGILEGASRGGYSLKIYDDGDLESTFDAIRSNTLKYVLCLVPNHAKREECAIRARKDHLKLVFAYETSHGEFPAVSANNFASSRAMMKLLLSKGHRKIALVCGEYQFWHYMTEKYNGYLSALVEAGIEPEFSSIICKADPLPSIRTLLARPKETRQTAFFCIGDGFAATVQREALKLGLELPRDISATGFGLTDGDETGVIPITTVDEHHLDIGRYAFELLTEGDSPLPSDPDGTRRVPFSIVEKESVFTLSGAAGS